MERKLITKALKKENKTNKNKKKHGDKKNAILHKKKNDVPFIVFFPFSLNCYHHDRHQFIYIRFLAVSLERQGAGAVVPWCPCCSGSRTERLLSL